MSICSSRVLRERVGYAITKRVLPWPPSIGEGKEEVERAWRGKKGGEKEGEGAGERYRRKKDTDRRRKDRKRMAGEAGRQLGSREKGKWKKDGLPKILEGWNYGSKNRNQSHWLKAAYPGEYLAQSGGNSSSLGYLVCP